MRFLSQFFYALSFFSLSTSAPLAQAQQPPLAAKTSLREVVDAAWLRSPKARTLEARREESLANRSAAQSWIAGSPTVGVSQSEDRWTDRTGRRETELSLSAPVWLPGQRSARQNLAQVSGDDLEAQISHARLTLAGEVRERVWAVAAAREALDEAQDHQAHLKELADEVMRRVKAGDLARTDGLIAQQEVLAAQATISTARLRLDEALARFTNLTGLQEIPPTQPEPVAPAGPDSHPRLLANQASVQRAQASLNVVGASRRDPPVIGIGTRRERDNAAMPTTRTLGISLQIPIGTAARNRPLETAALTQVATASAELAESETTVRTDIDLARQQLSIAQDALAAASARAAITREHVQLIDKAFRMGERGLAERIRAQALAHEADAAAGQQRVAVGLAHARLNQALGILP